MVKEFTDQIETFIKSLTENTCDIYYQAFDFSNVTDSRTQLMQLHHDKTKVSFLNLEMIADMFQVFTAVHSTLAQSSSRDFGVELPHRLSNTKSIGDALRTFGGYGKPYVVAVSVLDRLQSEELFEKISQLATVKKLTKEQMQDCMDRNADQIRRYYLGSANDQEQATYRNPVNEIVTRMVASKTS